MLPANQEILFTRQKHEAKRAGLHYDIRFVVGDKAFSFATKKDLPTDGKAILIYEQPVHDAAYALSKRVEIPEGQYGAGVTTLDFVRKAKVGEGSTADQMTIYAGDKKYLLKRMDEAKYGKKAWLFKDLPANKYLEKMAVHLHLMQTKDGKSKKWVSGDTKEPPKLKGFVYTGKSTYKRKGQNVRKSKV